MIKFPLLILFVLLQYGCATCRTSLIDTTTQGEWSAKVEYRVCGSVSGFGVSVYSNEEGAPGTGQGSLEPFQAFYKEHKHEPPHPIPLELTWIAPMHINIKHNKRKY